MSHTSVRTVARPMPQSRKTNIQSSTRKLRLVCLSATRQILRVIVYGPRVAGLLSSALMYASTRQSFPSDNLLNPRVILAVKHLRHPPQSTSNFRPLTRPLLQCRLLHSRLSLHHLQLYPLLHLHWHRQCQLPSQLRHRRRRKFPSPFPNISPNLAGPHGSIFLQNHLQQLPKHLPPVLPPRLLRPLRPNVNDKRLINKRKPLHSTLRHFHPWSPIQTEALSTL